MPGADSRSRPLKYLSTAEIVRRAERAPDFGWDDEGAELIARGLTWKWAGSRMIVEEAT